MGVNYSKVRNYPSRRKVPPEVKVPPEWDAYYTKGDDILIDLRSQRYTFFRITRSGGGYDCSFYLHLSGDDFTPLADIKIRSLAEITPEWVATHAVKAMMLGAKNA